MLKIIRKIRQELLLENKFSKYLIYAVGEIILVVLGILIALQINNINEESKDRGKEKIILETLLADLKTNKELIDQGFMDYDLSLNRSEAMANHFGRELYKKDLVLFDSIIYWSAEYIAIELLETSISSLATSGRLELLQKEALKQQIVRYPTYIELYKERENVVRSIVINEIRPNIEKHISMQKWWNIPESFTSDYAQLINNREISNNYLNNLFQTRDAISRLEKLKTANEVLLRAIQIELEDRFNL